MTKKQKKMLLRILIAAVMMAALSFVPVQGLIRFVLYLIPYFIVGYDILIKAFKGLINGRVLDECFLMAVATIGAMAIGVLDSGDYTEGIAVMLFYQTGELFQSYAIGKSRKNITALMDIRPDHANIEENGMLTAVDPDDVAVGTVITVRPGEKVPLDGLVIQGDSSLNTSALTGESLPKDVQPGDEVISGCVNMTGQLKIRTTREFGQSTVSRVLDLVENASSRKSRSEAFISKFARVYTPVVCSGALILALFGPILQMLSGQDAQWTLWLYRALSFLVASCPCALVISIPLSFFAGIGGASKEGILVKGSNYLEALSKTQTVAFDKTGTLTSGRFQVSSIKCVVGSKEDLIRYAAYAECDSSHPIAKCIVAYYGQLVDRKLVSNLQELAGKGVVAQIEGREVAVGNDKLMEHLKLRPHKTDEAAAVVHIAVDRVYWGCITVKDQLKPSASDSIQRLKKTGVEQTVMLTGDRNAVAEDIANRAGIDRVCSQLLPDQKVRALEELLESTKAGKTTVYVGDGINDAPVLARADVGIAMGAMGSDAAIEAADVVLMDDDPMKVSKAIRIAQKCMSIVHQNVVFAIGIKVLTLILVAFGMANMWLAIFADVGVMVLAVLNAIRAMFVKKL